MNSFAPLQAGPNKSFFLLLHESQNSAVKPTWPAKRDSRAPDALLASRNLRAPLRGACAGDWAARRLGNSAHTRQRQPAKRAERRLRRLQPVCETTVASHVRLGRFAAPVRRVSRRRGRGDGEWCVQRCHFGQGVLVTLRSLERPPAQQSPAAGGAARRTH